MKNTGIVIVVHFVFFLASTTGLTAEKKIPTLKLLKSHSSVYLDDMQEEFYAVRTGYTLGKRGATGYGEVSSVQFQGGTPAHCLSMHGRPKGDNPLAHARYKLDKKYVRFTGTVGFSKANTDPSSEVVFQVLGDNKVLWKSATATTNAFSEKVDIKIKGCRELILQVVLTGREGAATSVFVNPQLWYRADATPKILGSRRK